MLHITVLGVPNSDLCLLREFLHKISHCWPFTLYVLSITIGKHSSIFFNVQVFLKTCDYWLYLKISTRSSKLRLFISKVSTFILRFCLISILTILFQYFDNIVKIMIWIVSFIPWNCKNVCQKFDYLMSKYKLFMKLRISAVSNVLLGWYQVR